MEYLTLDIIANGMDSDGIARYNNKVYFVDGAIVGDKIDAKTIKENKNFNRAIIKNIITPSKYRSDAPCPYYTECGGCGLQHIDYEYQLKIKQNNIQSLFDKNKLCVKVKDVIKSNKTFEYRNKLTLYLSDKNVLGFYEKKSKNIIPINNCLLVDENFNNLIKIINKFLIINKNFALNLNGVAIREVFDCNKKCKYYLINLILKNKSELKEFDNYLKTNKLKYSLYFCVNKESNIPKYPCTFFGGTKEILQEEFGIVFPIYPMSFLQVNNEIKKQIYLDVLNEIKQNDVVLDAYSGAGLLSAIISKKAKKVFAVEIDKDANMASSKLQLLNNINNMASLLGDCAYVVPKLVKSEKLNTIILDPARKGADKKTLLAISKSNAQNVIYISCNPSTLTRDLCLLVGDYEIKSVQPYDMFPQTSEVETVVKLTKRK